jgi:hypothetical protein
MIRHSTLDGLGVKPLPMVEHQALLQVCSRRSKGSQMVQVPAQRIVCPQQMCLVLLTLG